MRVNEKRIFSEIVGRVARSPYGRLSMFLPREGHLFAREHVALTLNLLTTDGV